MRGGGRKHSQSFSPFCDSISADIAPVSLDSSIRTDEDAADEGNIFIRVVNKETRRGGNGMVRGDEKARKRELRAIYKALSMARPTNFIAFAISSSSSFFLSLAQIDDHPPRSTCSTMRA